jgi:hypothetical protein
MQAETVNAFHEKGFGVRYLVKLSFFKKCNYATHIFTECPRIGISFLVNQFIPIRETCDKVG